MVLILQIVGAIIGLSTFVCYIIVLIQLFKNGKTTIGIISIPLICCAGIGYIVALVTLMQNAAAWGQQQLAQIFMYLVIALYVMFVINTIMGGGPNLNIDVPN